jgi:hypothetical protein
MSEGVSNAELGKIANGELAGFISIGTVARETLDARRERNNLSRMVDRLSDGLADARRERDAARLLLDQESRECVERGKDIQTLTTHLKGTSEALAWLADNVVPNVGLLPMRIQVAIKVACDVDAVRAAEVTKT